MDVPGIGQMVGRGFYRSAARVSPSGGRIRGPEVDRIPATMLAAPNRMKHPRITVAP